MRLPGVGQKKAQAIVTHRAKAPFQRPEDVVQVKGLGPAWFGKVKPNLTTGGGAPSPATSQPARNRIPTRIGASGRQLAVTALPSATGSRATG